MKKRFIITMAVVVLVVLSASSVFASSYSKPDDIKSYGNMVFDKEEDGILDAAIYSEDIYYLYSITR